MAAWIPEANDIAGAAEFAERGTLRQKYGYQGQFDALSALTKQFMNLVEANA